MPPLPTRSETPAQRPARATIRDMARLAGVSIATVSRVLNNRPDVAPETREAVMRIVQEHGFTTNRSARGLSAGRTGIVGVTVPFVQAPYFALILAGAAEALYEQDMRVILCPVRHEHDREVTLLGRLMHGTTDGAILLLPSETSGELAALQRHGYPFVVVDPREPLGDGVPCVSAAHASGAKAATQHLLDLGHRRIAAITGPRDWTATDERLSGYHGAHVAAGILPDPELIVASDFLAEGGHRAAAAILDRPDPPTAIFCFNDNLAVGTVRAARERGLRVPEDLSIVGFDDSELASVLSPELTSVRQPLAEMGRMAVSLLVRLLDSQRLEALRVELATRLIVRESSGPAPVRSDPTR